VKVQAAVLETMLEQARRHLPEECCGLLAGAADVVTHCFPAMNALASEREFFIDPAELIKTLRSLRERGLKHQGIYHSHPAGDNFPSRRDLEMAYYPACAYFIISPAAAVERQIRAYRIEDGLITELLIERIPSPCGNVQV
jgi:proteasome lid subunit RPN8/RPN11